jgi:LmbE family N-acetylglucosaminyl deacetylase
VATLVCFHAHPDDESIATAGVMAAAAADGHRVVLVVATLGEEGEVAEGFLSPGESLAERREAETRASAQILGASRVEFLGYRDSGMVGTPANEHPAAFCQADLDEAAERLASILRDEGADVVTIYDENGVYGHPDHVQVHRVGVRAAERAGTPRVLESTMNRDHFRSMRAHASQISETSFFLAMPDEVFAMSFGLEWFIRRGVPVPVDEFEDSIFGE